MFGGCRKLYLGKKSKFRSYKANQKTWSLLVQQNRANANDLRLSMVDNEIQV